MTAPKCDTDENVCFMTYYVAFVCGLLSFIFPGFTNFLAQAFCFLWTYRQFKLFIFITCPWILYNHLVFYRSFFLLLEVEPKPTREHEPVDPYLPRYSPLLPPSENKTLFVNLDQTLIFSFTNPSPSGRYSSANRLILRFTNLTFYVIKRPGVEQLFRTVVSSGYEIVIFTASSRSYASPIIDWLYPAHEFVSHGLYRDACSMDDNRHRYKDLDMTGRRVDMSIIIEDDPSVYSKHYDNLIYVRPFKGNRNDSELNKLLCFFVIEKNFEDLRSAVDLYYGNFRWNKWS